LAVFIHFSTYTSGIWVPPVLKATMASLKRQAPGIQQTLPAALSVRHKGTSNDLERLTLHPDLHLEEEAPAEAEEPWVADEDQGPVDYEQFD